MGPIADLSESVTIVVTCIAAIRKYVPQLDGKWVFLSALVIAVLICLPSALGVHIPPWAAGIKTSLEVALIAVGGTEWATRLANKISTNGSAPPENKPTP